MMLEDAAELFAALLPVHLPKQHPIWLLRADPYLQYPGLTVCLTEVAKEGGTVFRACVEPVWTRRISHF